MYFNDYFKALSNEALFTKEILSSGLTQIIQADYIYKGKYFQAFNNLSIGLERIGKLCLILDFYIEGNGKFPKLTYLKTEIGHKLLVLYNKTNDIIIRRSISLRFLGNLENEIHQNILGILTNFAEGDRYSNLNLLTNGNYINDPVASWYNKVDTLICEEIPIKIKSKLSKKAKLYSEKMSNAGMVFYISETGCDITEFEDAEYRMSIKELIAPSRQLYLIHIIRFWVEVLLALQYLAQAIKLDDIPEFSEIFGVFNNPDSYIKTRHNWDGFY